MEKEIKISAGTSLEEAINKLLEAKANGEHVYCDFNGHMLHSDTVSMEETYKEILGKTKEEIDADNKEYAERYEREKAARDMIEQAYADRVAADREKTGERPITEELVVEGLKYIVANQSLSQDELIDGLLELGCNFSFEDIRKQYPDVVNINVAEGMRKGDVGTGASVVANMRDNEYGRNYGTDVFLLKDNDQSIYAFIRKVTGDESYTKESLEGKQK